MTRPGGLFLTPTREALLQGVADLEISLDESGTYRWLGNRKVNAQLEELERAGWIVFGSDTGIPHITGLGRIMLRQARTERGEPMKVEQVEPAAPVCTTDKACGLADGHPGSCEPIEGYDNTNPPWDVEDVQPV